MGEGLVSHLPVVQPKAEPETVDEGEPGTLAKGVGVDLGPGLGPSLAKGLDRSLVESFAPVLAKTLAKDEDEDEPETLASCNLKDLAAAEPAGLRVGKPVKIPSPGPPPGVEFRVQMSVLAGSVDMRVRTERKRVSPVADRGHAELPADSHCTTLRAGNASGWAQRVGIPGVGSGGRAGSQG
jgi:hypothetical protein